MGVWSYSLTNVPNFNGKIHPFLPFTPQKKTQKLVVTIQKLKKLLKGESDLTGSSIPHHDPVPCGEAVFIQIE